MHARIVTVALLLLTTAYTAVEVVEANDNLQIAYQWKEIDFEFANDKQRQEAIDNGTFVVSNVIPMGLEVYKNRLFLTLARWKSGVPASLAYINLNGE